jgi:Heavy-metal-associated domain
MPRECAESEVTYIVPNMDSDQSGSAVSRGLLASPRVEAVVVDPATKGVTVYGRGLDVLALRALIESAGYQAA